MDWLFDNLQFVIAVILLVVYGLRGIRRQSTRKDDDGPPAPEARHPQADPDEAERTRRIQDEIRRRILSRQRGEDPRQVVVFENEWEGEGPAPRTEEAPRQLPVPPPMPAPDFSAQDRAVLERQQALQDRLRALRAATAAPVPLLPMPGSRLKAPGAYAIAGVAHGRVLRELRNPAGVRRAIVMREILGLPQGLDPRPPHLPRR